MGSYQSYRWLPDLEARSSSGYSGGNQTLTRSLGILLGSGSVGGITVRLGWVIVYPLSDQVTFRVMNRRWHFLSVFLPPALAVGAMLLPPTLPQGQAQAAGEAPGRALTLRSDVQEANAKTGVVTARGNVQINYPARQIQATSAQAQYFSKERRIVLSGDVFVLQEGNSLRGETVTYLIDEGRFIAHPQPSSQVESIYIVSDPNAPTQPPTPIATPPPVPNFGTPPAVTAPATGSPPSVPPVDIPPVPPVTVPTTPLPRLPGNGTLP